MGSPVSSDELRVGTVEREDAVRLLGDHFSEGRLAVHEYEERVSLALESKTRGDLRPLFRDLPAPYPPFMVPPVQPKPNLPVYRPRNPAPVVYSDRSRVVAGVLQLLPSFGAGRFYTGHTGIAIAQLVTSMMFFGMVWCWIDGIVLLARGGDDAFGRPLQD